MVEKIKPKYKQGQVLVALGTNRLFVITQVQWYKLEKVARYQVKYLEKVKAGELPVPVYSALNDVDLDTCFKLAPKAAQLLYGEPSNDDGLIVIEYKRT